MIVHAAGIERSAPHFIDLKRGGGARDGKSSSLVKEKRVELLCEYLEEGTFVCDILTESSTKKSPTTNKHLVRGPVALVMMMTWRINERDAYDFWSRVRDGENITKDSAEMKLRDFLLSVNSISSREGRTYARVVSTREYVVRSILAWNAFRTGKPTVLKYVRGAGDIPKLR